MTVKVAPAGYCSRRLSPLYSSLFRISVLEENQATLSSLKSCFPLGWAHLQYATFLFESDINKSHKGALRNGMISLRFQINSSELLFMYLI